MAELDTLVAFNCSTNEYWAASVRSSKGHYYTVEWKFAPSTARDAQFDWECSCPAFKYGKGKHCKHINQVKNDRCGWNAELEPTEKPNQIGTEFFCPKCGDIANAIRVGV